MKPIFSVVARIRDDMGRVLLLKRADGDRAFQGWCLPGGRIEPGEHRDIALARELKEETGLYLEESRFLFRRETSSPIGGMFIVDCFDVIAYGNVQLSPEHSKWRYISPAVASKIELAGPVTRELVLAPVPLLGSWPFRARD